MSFKSLGNPFDGNSDLTHGPGCSCPICVFARQQGQAEYERTETELTAKLEKAVFEGPEQPQYRSTVAAQTPAPDAERTGRRCQPPAVGRRHHGPVIESAIVRSVFGHHEPSRREFMRMIGGGTMAALFGSLFPMEAAKAAIKESLGKPEKAKLKIGFVPSPAPRRSSCRTRWASMPNTVSMSR